MPAAKSFASPVSRPTTQFVAVPNRHYDDESHGLCPRDKTTYEHLYRLSFGFGQDTCWISIDRLADRVVVSRNTVKTALESLEEKKKIKVISRGNDGLIIKVHSLFEEVPQQILSDVPSPPIKQVAVLQLNQQENQKDEPPELQQDQNQIDAGQNLKNEGQNLPPLKKELKEIDLKHTQEQVSDGGPVIQLKDIVDGIGFTSPLAGLNQSALNLAYKLAPAWHVLRLLITLLVGYLYRVEAVLNPLALIKWAIKSRDFIALEDKDIAFEFVKKIKHFIGHIPQNERHYFSSELPELIQFRNWIDVNFEKITLADLYKEFNIQCKATSSKYSFIWFFLVTDPVKDKSKKK